VTVLADAIAADVLGVEIPPLAHEIDARWLMAYAAGLGETDPRYFDTLGAGGPWAHPLFPVCYEWPAALALREHVVAAALQPRSVHATHHVIVHRPPRAGDTLYTIGRVVVVEPRRAGTRVVSRFVTTDAAGRPVTTTDYGSVYRDVPVAGRVPPAPSAAPPAREAITSPAWLESIDVAANAAWVYTECARIFNPIHTDLAVARGVGLDAPILHGTATLALAISRALRQHGADALDAHGARPRLLAGGARLRRRRRRRHDRPRRGTHPARPGLSRRVPSAWMLAASPPAR
jgi:acyl dehydratase